MNPKYRCMSSFLYQFHLYLYYWYILSMIRSMAHFLPKFVLDWLTCRISSNDPHPAQNSNHITIYNSCSLQIHSKLAAFHYSYSIISNMNKVIHFFQISTILNRKLRHLCKVQYELDCHQVYSIFTLPDHSFFFFLRYVITWDT